MLRKYIFSKQLLLHLPREVDCKDEQMEDILSVVTKRSISIMLKKIEIPIFKILCVESSDLLLQILRRQEVSGIRISEILQEGIVHFSISEKHSVPMKYVLLVRLVRVKMYKTTINV